MSPAGPGTFERLAATSGGVRLHVERWGAGKPCIVLGHGFGGSSRNFRPQARVLSTSHEVVLFDARGHAKSDAPPERAAYRPECFVADVAAVLDAVGAAQAVVGGLSMGAGIALRFALAHPERVQALVLAAFPRAAADPGHLEWSQGFARAIADEGLESAGARYVWGERSRFDPRGADLIRRGFLEHRPEAIAHVLTELLATQPAPQELAPALTTLSVPTLIVVGSEDQTSLASSHAIADALPGSVLVVVPGGGHVVNLTNQSEFNQALSAFLERVA